MNRKLDPTELSMEIMNTRARSWFGLTVARIRGPLDEDVVRKALDMMQHRHAKLNFRIVGPPDDLRFVSEGTLRIPLRVVVASHSQEWEDVALAELNKNIESDKCLMRATLVRHHDDEGVAHLMLADHHAIIDALSKIQLMGELFTYIRQLSSGNPEPVIERMSELPPLEKMMPEITKSGDPIPAGTGTFETLPCEKAVPMEFRRAGFVHRGLDEEQTLRLMTDCSKKKISVSGAMCAAILLEVAAEIRQEDDRIVSVACLSYVDLRRRMGASFGNEALGTLFSSLTTFHSICPDTSFWELAGEVKAKIHDILRNEDMAAEALRIGDDVEHFLTDPDKPYATAELSNIGQLGIPSAYGSFVVEEVHAMTAQAVLAIPSFYCLTFQGRLWLYITYSEPFHTRGRMERIADGVMAILGQPETNKIPARFGLANPNRRICQSGESKW